MAEYKPPVSRVKVIKALEKAFRDSLDGFFGKTDQDEVEFNLICDTAHGLFNDSIEDGETARKAKEIADEDFNENLRALIRELSDKVGSVADDLIDD